MFCFIKFLVIMKLILSLIGLGIASNGIAFLITYCNTDPNDSSGNNTNTGSECYLDKSAN